MKICSETIQFNRALEDAKYRFVLDNLKNYSLGVYLENHITIS